MATAVRKIGADFLLYPLVFGVTAVFEAMRLVEPRFRRALASFEATYQFRSGRAAARLVFSKGGVKTRLGQGPAPDCEIDFVDLAGALRAMLKDPNDLLTLLLENKIAQTGDAYHIYRFGYLWGLIRRSLHDLAERTAGG